MQISNIQNHNFSNPNNVSFKAVTNFDRHLMPDTGKVSLKTTKLIHELNKCIDKEWRDIRKGAKHAVSPKFFVQDGNNIIKYEPVYSQSYPALLIEANDGKNVHKILLDRDNPNNFRYEKTVVTDFGYATLKSYNSKTENNSDLNKFVSNLIENSTDKIIRNKMWDRVLDRTRDDYLFDF